jgi:hypothetical protein
MSCFFEAQQNKVGLKDDTYWNIPNVYQGQATITYSQGQTNRNRNEFV